MRQSVSRILAGRAADAYGVWENAAILLNNGRIEKLEKWSDSTRVQPGDLDARDALVVPGFIDIHVHGGAGRSVMEGSTEALQVVGGHLARHGVTGYLATTVTAPLEETRQVLAAVTQQMEREAAGEQTGARLLGCHLEGPYINPEMRGAQPLQYVRKPDVEEFLQWAGPWLQNVRIVTVAPEMEGALPLITVLAARGIRASIGHTNATCQQVEKAIAAGARQVTHCFNAMRPLQSREPGVVGAAMAHRELDAELIWDNIHVHPLSCKVLIDAKGTDKVILISDGIPGAGMEDGYTFSLGDLPVVVQNGAARLPNGTLAGSLLTLNRAFANAVPYSLCQRAALTSCNAARALGCEHTLGRIAAGFDADMAVLREDSEVVQTLTSGRVVWQAD